MVYFKNSALHIVLRQFKKWCFNPRPIPVYTLGSRGGNFCSVLQGNTFKHHLQVYIECGLISSTLCLSDCLSLDKKPRQQQDFKKNLSEGMCQHQATYLVLCWALSSFYHLVSYLFWCNISALEKKQKEKKALRETFIIKSITYLSKLHLCIGSPYKY